MALSTVSQDEREVKNPGEAGNVVFTRTVESTVSPPTLTDFEVRGYSTEFGGQKVEPLDVSVSTTNSSDGSNYYLDIEFAFDSFSDVAGTDFVIEYTVEDDNATETSNFFFQNGVYGARAPGASLMFRGSAELERLSETFEDGENVNEMTDFSDVSRRAQSGLEYVSASSPFSKHTTEPIPYFGGSGTVDFPSQSFSSRQSSVVIACQWNQVQSESFPVFRLVQGSNTYLEIRNDQSDITLESDLVGSTLYSSSTYAGDIMIAEVRIGDSEVFGTVNREIDRSSSVPTGSFESGNTSLEINPQDKPVSPKLFDVLVYDNPLSSEELDRLSKHLSYFYKADLTSPKIATEGSGSTKVQNHLLYNSETEQFDVIQTGGDTRRYDPNGNLVWDFTIADGTAVAVDSRSQIGLGTGAGNDVHRISSQGDLVWTFGGHSDSINSIELGVETYTYSASEDGTVKKLDRTGTPVWNFDQHAEAVNDIAVYEDIAIYSVSDDETVRRIVDSTGSEDWSFTEHLADVFLVEADRNENVYTASSNGELRVVDEDGNQVAHFSPFESNPVEDMAVRNGSLYVVSGDILKKIDTTDGSEIWKQGVFESNDNKTAQLVSVAVSPSGSIYVAENLENNILEFDDSGSKISEFSVSGGTLDLTVQPGTFEPHWN